MRCIACDTALTDYEATRKDKQGDFIDLCNDCFRNTTGSDEVYSRSDLESEADIEQIIDIKLDKPTEGL
jgi:hypothetical protein